MTLLDDALKAQENGEFISWYASLSDEKREQFGKEISNAVGSIAEMFNDLISQVPLVLANIVDNLMKK